MITFATKAHPTAVEAIIHLLETLNKLPETLTLYGSDGHQYILRPDGQYAKTHRGKLQLAWANRRALNGNPLRWLPSMISINVDIPQSTVDKCLQDGLTHWNETMQRAYIECQIKRYANGVRDNATAAVIKVYGITRLTEIANEMANEMANELEQEDPDY